MQEYTTHKKSRTKIEKTKQHQQQFELNSNKTNGSVTSFNKSSIILSE